MGFEQLETLGPVLVRIDELQARVNEAKASRPDAYDRVMESWAVESTYNSNCIEGSTLSLGDTALVYDGAQVDGPFEDIRQAEGGFAALGFLRAAVGRGEPLTEALIRRAHELVFAEAKDPATRGAYRTVEVEITGTSFQPAPSVYVPERMAELVAACGKTRRHPAIVAALFHLEFESIHPFVNANGRTGRLMSNYLLMAANFEPLNIQAESRARYITAIRAFQENDDPYPFVAFFCLNLAERLEKVLALLVPQPEKSAGCARSGIDAFLRGSDDGSGDGSHGAA
jgi:Fic family protein